MDSKLAFLSLFYILITSKQTLSQDINYPLCTGCDCKNVESQQPEVYCTKNVKSKLFDENSWRDTKNNITYNYASLSIQNSAIFFLDKQFPPSNIQLLNLANNSIVNISDNVFSNLQKMEVLILSDNQIETIHPDAFKGLYLDGDFLPLRSLKILKLDNNKIYTFDEDLFEHTSRIENLSLSHNPIRSLNSQTIIAITSLVFLKHLDLSYTELSSLPNNFLHTPKYLKFLDLTGNNLNKIPETLAQTNSLEVLYLDRNPITVLTNETGFPIVKTLKVLHMCYMPQLTNISKHSLSNLENLEELHISNNIDLKYIDRNALSSRKDGAQYETWPPIKQLYLANNKLSSIDMNLLLRWEGLSNLDLTNNAWTCECENQWLIDELIPLYLEIDEFGAKSMRCAAPVEMVEFTIYDLYEKHSEMRCLDSYGNRPEKDAAMLVGMLAGILIAVPLILFIIYAYQRHWFGLFDSSPAAFSRQFYKRTLSNDEYF